LGYCSNSLDLGNNRTRNFKFCLQKLDEDWTCFRLDTNTNYFRGFILHNDYPNRLDEAAFESSSNDAKLRSRVAHLSPIEQVKNYKKYGETILMLKDTLDFLKDIGGFIKEQKNYLLIPLIFTLVSLGALIVFAQSSAIAPFIYTLF
jgi:hypothetical protein